MSQLAVYSEYHCTLAGITLELLGISSWNLPQIRDIQSNIGAKEDGWFGPKSIKKWKAWARINEPTTCQTGKSIAAGQLILDNRGFPVPEGVIFVNHLEPGGVPAQLEDTAPRKYDPYQFVIHRGAQTKRKGENYAQATERVLDGKGCSTTFTMGTDGVIYQHFDPTLRRGRHCSYHNAQSDSIDVAGPFSRPQRKPVDGQEPLTLLMAIGRKNDGKPPLARKNGIVRCWTMTPDQRSAFKVFVPWYCKLRGIPVTACEDWRTFRLSGGLKTKDPVTTGVKGIIAHTNVANPGSRVDGILPLHHLKEDGAEIEWRTAENFFNQGPGHHRC